MIPKPLDNLTFESKGFGISRFIKFYLVSATNDFRVQWKMLSSDLEYTDAELRIHGEQVSSSGEQVDCFC